MSTPSSNSTANSLADAQTEQRDTSLSTFTSALVFNLVIFIAIYIVFCILRPRNRNVYAPRTYMVADKSKRPPPLSSGPFRWIWSVLRTPQEELLYKVGLDSYMLLRFLRSAFHIFGIMNVLGLGILLPLNATGGNNKSALDQLTVGNISPSHKDRLWAHLALVWIWTGLILYILIKELRAYIRLRHQYMTSPERRRLPRNVTVLVTAIPEHLQSETALKNLFGGLPGGVAHVTLVRDAKNLIKTYNARNKTVLSLEAAECAYIKTGEQTRAKTLPIPASVPIIGTHENAIQYSKRRLKELENVLADERTAEDRKVLSAAFIIFHSQCAAQLAAQAIAASTPLKMSERWTEVHPDDVIWSNLGIGGISRWWRRGVSILACTGLIITWAILVTTVSAVASLDSLSKALPFLSGVKDWNPKIVGIIQGILPPMAIAILMLLLPIILSRLTKFEGAPLNSVTQLGVTHKYYFFLVVNVLLVVTFSGGIFKSLNKIKDSPTSITTILATQMPLASTFFITYVLLNAFSGSAQELLMIKDLLTKWVKSRSIVKTPRQVWENMAMPGIDWGMVVPNHVLIFDIGITYAMVAPLILPFVFVYFALFYFIFRYQFLYIYDQAEYASMNGRVYPIIVDHVFTGIYIAILTMIGIFGLQKAVGQTILGAVLLVSVIIVNFYVERAYRKLLAYVPIESLLATDRNETYGTIHGTDSTHPSFEEGSTTNDSSIHTATAQTKGVNNTYTTATTGPSQAQVSAETYLHPAFYKPAPIVWLPNDEENRNIAADECHHLHADGILATTAGAVLDARGRIKVIPDEVPLQDEDSVRHELEDTYH